ncbi:surface lipoprotein assembly modifier [Shinella sp. BYT-45]|uniref:surface lipoprotein assembly modifier n=1 Tax=Shinella sp. BYT-45 TaxID=3377377 RepID=UPI00397F5F82
MSKSSLVTILAILFALSGAPVSVARAMSLAPVDMVNLLVLRKDFAMADGLARRIAGENRRLAWLPDYVRVCEMLSAGRFRAAEDRARRLAARYPAEPDIRHALINALWGQKKYRAALFQIERNKPLVKDRSMRAAYEALVDEYNAVNKPYGLSISVGAVPSSNVNNGASTDTVDVGGLSFELSDDAKAREGVNVTATASVYYLHQLGENVDILGKGAVHLAKSLQSRDRDELTFIASPEVQIQFDSARFGAGPLVEYQLSGYDAYALRYGIGGFYRRNFDHDISLAMQAKLLRQDYFEDDFRDGHKYAFQGVVGFPLSASADGTFKFSYEKEKTKRDYLDSDAYSLGFGLSNTWSRMAGLTTNLSVQYRWQNFRGDYPLTGQPRQDGRLTASISISHEKLEFWGISPSIGYEFIDNKSNVAIKSYTAHNFIVGVNRTF